MAERSGTKHKHTRCPPSEDGMADLDKLAIEAEADRLSGVFLRVEMLAQAQRTDLATAGRDAVAKGLVSAADWVLVEEALAGR